MKFAIPRKIIALAIFAVIFILYRAFNSESTPTDDKATVVSGAPALSYKLLVNNETLAIVQLREPLNKIVDTSVLNTVADSLFEHSPAATEPNLNSNYIVRFYYRDDWKGKTCYAMKSWVYGYQEKKMLPFRMEVTGITGDDKQDEINRQKKFNPIRSSFDTVAYLQKIEGLSKKQVHALVSKQLDDKNQVKAFVSLCKSKLDSAGVVTDGKDNYTYLYHNHFINVWGNVSYPVTKNDFTYSKIITFESSYDLFGNQVYFKQQF